ncbi:MAG: hypothetical protein U1E29_17025, partial [Coriobacteriia bacterium]|nr:hypothetical protein [Coriobacteriia bacterium]
MSDNVGNPDARPDLDLDEAFGDDQGTIDEQEMADAEAGCGQTAIGIPLAGRESGGHPRDLRPLASPPSAAAEAASGHPGGHPAGIPGGPGG